MQIVGKLPVNGSTPAKQVREWFQANEGVDIKSRQAWAVKRALVGDKVGAQAQEFMQLPMYAQCMRQADPSATIEVSPAAFPSPDSVLPVFAR